MRPIHFLLFLVTLPLLMAIGHDIYMYTQHQDKGLMLSALGYIWTTYHPESYKWTNENVDAGTWEIINMVLAQKTILLGGAFAAVMYALIWLVSLPFGEKKAKKSDRIDFLNKDKKGAYKYGRK